MSHAQPAGPGEVALLQQTSWSPTQWTGEYHNLWGAALSGRDVTVRPTWVGIPTTGEGEPGGQIVGSVAMAGPQATLGPGTSVLIPREPDGREWIDAEQWICAEDDLLVIPSTIPPSLAVLARPLAVARRALAELPAGTTRVLIRGYHVLGALVHAEVDRLLPGVRVTVVERRSRAALLAAAFGARIVDTAIGQHDVEILLDGPPSGAATIVIDLSATPSPTPADTAAALDLLADQCWRYVPIITDGLTATEARSGVGDLDDAVKAVVCL